MNVTECIKTRRSIRKFKPDPVDHSIIDSVVSSASYSPSWKNTQITRYIAVEDRSVLSEIADKYTPDYNSKIIRQAPVLMAVTFVKGRCGFERDGSFTTKKKTAGRCLTQVCHARLFVLQHGTRVWGLSSWVFSTRTASQSCSAYRKTRNLGH